MYRAPMSFRPPLAHGGHCWLLAGQRRDVPWAGVATCVDCFVTVPFWALREGFWMTLAGRWCPGQLAALQPGPRGTLTE
jgi:hypothetical protein